jgi:beta-glucosidase
MVSDITVDIEQAKGIPGTAVLSLSTTSHLKRISYYLNFDVQSTSDEFNSASVGKQWEWVRENQATI